MEGKEVNVRAFFYISMNIFAGISKFVMFLQLKLLFLFYKSVNQTYINKANLDLVGMWEKDY